MAKRGPRAGDITYSITTDTAQSQAAAKKLGAELDATGAKAAQATAKLREMAKSLQSGGAMAVAGANQLPAGTINANEQQRARIARMLERDAARIERQELRRQADALARSQGIDNGKPSLAANLAKQLGLGKFASGGMVAGVGAALLTASVATSLAQGETARINAARGARTDTVSQALAGYAVWQETIGGLIGRIPILGDVMAEQFKRAADSAQFLSESIARSAASFTGSMAGMASLRGDTVAALQFKQNAERRPELDAMAKAQSELNRLTDPYDRLVRTGQMTQSAADSEMSRDIKIVAARDAVLRQRNALDAQGRLQRSEMAIAQSTYDADLNALATSAVGFGSAEQAAKARLNSNELGAMRIERAAERVKLEAALKSELARMSPDSPQAMLAKNAGEARLRAFDMESRVLAKSIANNPQEAMVTSAREAFGGAYPTQGEESLLAGFKDVVTDMMQQIVILLGHK